MNYIVLDLEWNMGSPKEELKMMPFEIIEIGAVRLDSEKKETGRFSRLIHPKVYKNMHRINSNIVHLTDQDLKDAEDFEIVYSEFQSFCEGEPFIFCTWGDTDLTELQRNINYFDLIPLSEGPIEFLDVQKLLGYNKGLPKERMSLEKASQELSIPESSDFHRALSDAIYTAEILKRIDRKYEIFTSFNSYHTPETEKDEINKNFGTYKKMISKTYPDKQFLMRAKNIRGLRCPVCDKKLKKEIPWFTTNNKHYMTIGRCSVHGEVKSKIRIKKDEIKKGVYAVKTTRLINTDETRELLQKHDKAESRKQLLEDQKSILSKSD